MNPTTAIIILNYNGWQDTIQCLESVYETAYDNYEVVLIDNASTDDSLLRIREYCNDALTVNSASLYRSSLQQPIRLVEYAGETVIGKDAADNKTPLPCNKSLVLIKNDRNRGFAEGVNIGIRYALKALDPAFILVLNNDTIVDSALLHTLVDLASRDNRIGLAHPKVLRCADSAIDQTGILCDMLGYTRHRGWGEEDRGQYNHDRERGFFYAGGACVLVSKNLLSDLGGECFDPDLFAYHEDVDLSWMARLLGYRIVYCPTALCYHKGGATSGGQNPQTAYFVYKNRLRVLIKNYSLKTLAAALPITILLKLSLLSGGAIASTNTGYLRSFVKALLWNVYHLRTTLSRRAFIQSKRTLPDKEVMHFMIRHSLELDSALKALSIRRGL